MTQQQSAAPGWYPAGAVQRYWNGSQWTEHTAPLPQPQQVVYAAPTRYVTTQKKNTWHGMHLILTVLTCGLWGLVWFIVTIVNGLRPRRSVTRAR